MHCVNTIDTKGTVKESVVKEKSNTSEAKPVVEETTSETDEYEPKTKLDCLEELYGRIRTMLNYEELKAFLSIIEKDVRQTGETIERLKTLPVETITRMITGEKQ